MATLKSGDVVRLKSGGSLMTIKVIELDEAYCEWFAKEEVKGASFAISQLEAEN